VTITREQVLDLVLPTLPSVPPLLDEDAGELPYIDAGGICAHVTDLFLAGRGDELTDFFAVVERLHVEGDPYVRELATIGYLESLQDVAALGDPEVLVPLLGPESRRWWRGLNAFWSGTSPTVVPLD